MFTKKGDAAVLAKLADAPAQYRDIGERLHRVIRESAPELEPIVRWGLPFYAARASNHAVAAGVRSVVVGVGRYGSSLARRRRSLGGPEDGLVRLGSTLR
jgi:hypothetical protein